jgi:hypothetical protein
VDDRDDIPPIPAAPAGLTPVEPAPAVAPPAPPTPPAPPAYSAAPAYAAPPAYGPPPGYTGAPAAPAYAPGYSQPYNPAVGQAGYAYVGPPPQGLALASLLTAIGAVFVGPLASIAAVILGHIAQKRQPWARGMWLTGLIIGYVGIGLSIVFIAIYIVFIASLAATQDF